MFPPDLRNVVEVILSQHDQRRELESQQPFSQLLEAQALVAISVQYLPSEQEQAVRAVARHSNIT